METLELFRIEYPDAVRVCAKCRQSKPLVSYHKHPHCKGGRYNICPDCRSIPSKARYRRKRSALGKKPLVKVGGVVAISTARKGDARADGMIFYSKRNRTDGKYQEWWVTPEKFAALAARAREKAREKFKTDSAHREKQRRINTSPESRARKRAWNKRNSHYLSNYHSHRRAKMVSQISILTESEKNKCRLFYKFRNLLNKVHGGKRMFEVDHIRPIARGGLHHPDNLRVTTAKFNHLKFVNDLCPQTLRKRGEY